MKGQPHSDMPNLRGLVYDVAVIATVHQNFLCARGDHKMLLPPRRLYSSTQTQHGETQKVGSSKGQSETNRREHR